DLTDLRRKIQALVKESGSTEQEMVDHYHQGGLEVTEDEKQLAQYRSQLQDLLAEQREATMGTGRWAPEPAAAPAAHPAPRRSGGGVPVLPPKGGSQAPRGAQGAAAEDRGRAGAVSSHPHAGGPFRLPRSERGK